MEEHLRAIAEGFWGFKFFEAETAIKRGLAAGVPKPEIMKTLLAAFHQAVERYDQGEFCIAHLAALGSILEMGYELAGSDIEPKGKVIIGTLGSSHYLGKDIVRLLLMTDGFDVVDLGEIVFAEDVIEAVEREKPDIVALSTMIIECLPLQRGTVGLLGVRGLRDKVKVMVGGAITSPRWAAEIGADAWAGNGPDAVKEANRLLEQLKGAA